MYECMYVYYAPEKPAGPYDLGSVHKRYNIFTIVTRRTVTMVTEALYGYTTSPRRRPLNTKILVFRKGYDLHPLTGSAYVWGVVVGWGDTAATRIPGLHATATRHRFDILYLEIWVSPIQPRAWKPVKTAHRS